MIRVPPGTRGSAGRLVVLAGALFVLAACGWAEWPPRDARYRTARPPAPAPQVAAPSGLAATGETSEVVVAGRGDTVYALSRRHRIGVRAIIEANGLNPPYHLTVGQRIVLPRGREHVVAKGETLYSIAQRYGISVYDMARANRVDAGYAVRTGERLVIPRGAAPVVAAVAPSSAPASVVGGSVTREELAPPPGGRAAPGAALDSAPPATPAPVTGSETPAAPAPADPPVQTASAALPAVPAPPASIGFAWPVRGKIISAFGTKAKGLRNDGINIAAPHGAPVRAAESGVVAYAGNELRGFGNLLLIKHADGWVTAYAHNDVLLAKRGETVAKGQIIARVGNSGNVTSPQLHFEIRQGKRAVDPQQYLGSI